MPALPIAAQPCDEENKNRDRGRREEKKTHVCVLIPNVQHPVVKVRGSAARQREHHHAYGPLLGTTAQHRAPRIFQIDFHPGKKITRCYYSRDRGWKDAFRLLGQASGEHSAVQQQYSTWAALVLKLLDRNVYIRDIRGPTSVKLTKYRYRLMNISKSSKDSNSNKWSWGKFDYV